MSDVGTLLELALPGRTPDDVRFLLLIAEDGGTHLVITPDTAIDRFFTAGTIIGQSLPQTVGLPGELDFVNQIIVSEKITLMEPLLVTPNQVNRSPEDYAFKRVRMDSTYLFTGVRVGDAPLGLEHLGFGLATDNLGSQSRDDYLTVVDPHNTETQIRVAELTGTVLPSADRVRLLLEQVYRFSLDEVEEALSRPSVFLEDLVDDPPKFVSIGSIAPTLGDPSPKLHDYHGDVLGVHGFALGEMIRAENIPQLQNLPVQLTFKVIGIADPTGVMPIVGVSSEDLSVEVFGFHRFDLSVYSFGEGNALAFLIRQEPVPLDPVTDIGLALPGQRVRANLNGYLVTEMSAIQVPGLVFEEVDILAPTKPGDPLVMTRHPDLATGNYIGNMTFDGFVLDGGILGIPEGLITKYGSRIIVVNYNDLTYEIAVPPTPVPSPTRVPTPRPRPTPQPIPTPPPLPPFPFP